MKRRGFLAGSAATLLCLTARSAIGQSSALNAADTEWLIDQISAHYAYLPDRHVNLDTLRAIYVPQARAATDSHTFLGVLERMLAEFHDHHIETSVNNAESPQLVPTGSEIWCTFQNGRVIVEEVRPASSAENAHVRAGDEITTIGDVSVAEAVAASAPRALSSPDPEANDYVLRVLLAGTHSARRVFSVRSANGTERRIDLLPHVPDPQKSLLTVSHIGTDIASIRIENSLGDGGLVKAFDDALVSTRDARGVVLDLRNTPSGGDTDVAEPILGRFIKGRQGYQRQFVSRPGKVFPRDSTVRWVRERGPFQLTCDLVVLCDRWTGSMGEGMTIGLDAMHRAKIVGTRMAGLCGATEVFTLPQSRIGARFPTLRLYHLNGTPREKFVPGVLVDLAHANGDDPILARGLAVLREGWR